MDNELEDQILYKLERITKYTLEIRDELEGIRKWVTFAGWVLLISCLPAIFVLIRIAHSFLENVVDKMF